MLSPQERMDTARFLQGLRHLDGGYAEVAGGSPGLQPVLSVAKACRLLGVGLEAPDATAAFVRGCLDPATGGFVLPGMEGPGVFPTAMAILALGELGATGEQSERLPAAMRFMAEHATAREEHFMAIGVADECQVAAPAQAIAYFRAMEREDGTFGPSVLDNAIAGSALLRARQPLTNPGALALRLLAAQGEDGGFAEGGGPATLWVTYCCMRALDLLGQAPDVSRLGPWLRAMLRPAGGLGEPGKDASAGVTYQALTVLDWIVAPVLRAARAGENAVLERWLAGGGDPDVRALDGWTPLHAAAVCGRADTVSLLLSPPGSGVRGADPDLRMAEADALPVFWAGQSGDLETALALLRARPEHLFASSRVNGHTVLLQAAFFGSERHRALAARLLEHVGSILGLAKDDAEGLAKARWRLTVATNARGYNATTMAELWGNRPMAELLGAYDRSTADERRAYHQSFLDRIARQPPVEAREVEAQALTERLIAVIQEGLTAAGRTSPSEPSPGETLIRVAKLLEAPHLDLDRLGGPLAETPLIVAVTGLDGTPEQEALRRSLVILLLEHGADPDRPELHPMGVDAVIRTAVLNHFELLKLIGAHMKPLAFAAALNERPAINGQTALQDTVHRALTASGASLDRHLAQIRWVVQHGARVDIPDHTGTSPEGLARKALGDGVYRERAEVVLAALGVAPPQPSGREAEIQDQEVTAMTNEEALTIIEPFYDLFRAHKRDWEKGLAVLADDWRAYYTNDDSRTKEETRPYLEGLFALVPDIDVTIKQVRVAGDVIAVRSEISGTPAADFLVPHSGRSFRIMTIDLNRVQGGKIVELYHLEDWGTAIRQLSGQAS